MRQRKEGSITVFLTFIFLVIIALGCGMIELARGSVAEDQAQRLLCAEHSARQNAFAAVRGIQAACGGLPQR